MSDCAINLHNIGAQYELKVCVFVSFLVSSFPKGKKEDNDEESKKEIGGGNM